MVKELLSFRIEIDLNYLDLTPANICLFGWNIDEPLIIAFTVREGKLLNLIDPPEIITFSKAFKGGMLEFSVRLKSVMDIVF